MAKLNPARTRTKPKKRVRAKSKPKRAKAPKREYVHEPPRSEYELFADAQEDLRDAWIKLREFAAGLGEQRIYTSAKAVMFARKTCYLFVRPKKSYLEVCFFLAQPLKPPAVFKVQKVASTRHVHTVKVVHPDQVEEPLTDWVAEAFRLVPAAAR